MTVIGAHPPRRDFVVYAGTPVDFTLPVLNADGTAVTTLVGWTAAAQIRATPDGPILAILTATIDGVTVRITATHEQTATWTFREAQWDLIMTSPTGIPTPFCVGWVRLYLTITH